MIIVRIEPTETRLFPTKSKTNFSCCFELISPEEYLMRNFYSYKSKRDKLIQQQLQKISDFDNKQTHSAKSLLVLSNQGHSIGSIMLTKNKNSREAQSTHPRGLKPEDSKSRNGLM